MVKHCATCIRSRQRIDILDLDFGSWVDMNMNYPLALPRFLDWTWAHVGRNLSQGSIQH